MATAKGRHGHQRRTSRRTFRLVAALVAVLGLVLWMYRAPVEGYSTTATSFAARTVCSCHFIGGRDLSQCRDDLEPGMGLVMLSADEEAKSVTARLPILSTQTASYREGWGCILEPWED